MAAAVATVGLLAPFAAAQANDGNATTPLPTSDKIRIGGDQAYNWSEGETRVLFVDGNVTLQADDATLSADRAVIWLTPGKGDGTPGAPATEYDVQIALLGNAKVTRGEITREGPELFVTIQTRPDVQLDAAALTPGNRSGDVHYLAASQLRRRALQMPAQPLPPGRATTRSSTTQPTTEPTSRPVRPPGPPLTFNAARVSTEMTPEGRVALVLSGDEKASDVLLVQTRPDGSRVQLQANRVVIFSYLTDARQLMQGRLGQLDADRDVDAAYLEGDVRINVTPALPNLPEQSLRASRVVYEFATDRAVLTDVLLHSYDPNAPAPLSVRARTMRQLGANTYEADGASITTSNFNTPAIALSASKVTVRQADTGDPRIGTRTSFVANNVTPRIYGLPVFWLPRVWGSTSEGGGVPLRDVSLSSSSGFGVGLETQWGLFETLGLRPPEGTDASYRLDYFTKRGPAFGFDTHYAGGAVNESTLQPWSCAGDFTAYGVYDEGVDRLGKRRGSISFEDDPQFRGRVRWDHQQFLTDGWQVQARLGYTSDGTFLEEWFRNEFRNGQPLDTSLYVKRSIGSEFFSVYGNVDLNNVATVADQLQEVNVGDGGFRNPLIVERLPEVTYQRLGDSLADDRLTLMSNNSLAGLHFSESYAGLQELGLGNRGGTPEIDESFAGIPSYGYTGYTDAYVVRGDFRQEVSMPLGDDRFRIVPYGVVRYTAYSDAPDASFRDRILVGTGIRSSTQFHKTYDNARSKLFDVDRVRHIIEPQMNLFGAVQTRDRTDFWIYDEDVDGVSDIAAAQFNIRQRFQTKRGAPGKQRSVDFLTFNTGVSLFANEPEEPTPAYDADGDNTFEDAGSFRGLFFNGMPEASVARSTLFADSIWRVTDTTAILSDVSWNIDNASLATLGTGVAIQREPRVQYFVGARYIGELNSTIGTFSVDYELTQRYSIAFNESFNLTEGASQNTSLELVRKFEQFVLTLTVYFDQIEDEGGIAFSVSPRNIPLGFRVNNGGGSRR